jgi:hypothetical protein
MLRTGLRGIKLQTWEYLLGIEKTRQKGFCRIGWNYKKPLDSLLLQAVRILSNVTWYNL